MSRKHIVISGAASGIGAYLWEEFIARGDYVFACDINLAGLQKKMQLKNWTDAQCQIFEVDVSNLEHWTRVYELIAKKTLNIDVHLNIAGYLKPSYLIDSSNEEIMRHINVNVLGVIYGSRAAAQHMLRNKSGHIINIASLAGIAPITGIGMYSVSKFAARSFSLILAQELKDQNIKVTVVCPDAVKTPMLDLQKDFKEAALTFSGPRHLTVEEIGKAIFEVILPKAPWEYNIPKSRAWLAHLANIFPQLISQLGPFLKAKGLKAQNSYNKGSEDGAGGPT